MKKYNAGGMARPMPAHAKGGPNRGAAAAGRGMPAQAGAARRMMAQQEAMPMKKGGKVKMQAGGEVRGKGAATKGYKANGPLG